MRILLVSKFLHHVGGVETYLRWLSGALRSAGCEVAVLGMSTDGVDPEMDFNGAPVYRTKRRDYTQGTALHRIRSAATSIYSPSASSVMKQALAEFVPDVVHYHGTCYQLTSSVVRATSGLPLRRVATAHDYKLSCANQRLWDDSQSEICTACVGGSKLTRITAPVRRSCIKGNVGASAIGGIEAALSDGVWRRADNLTIHAPSKFMAGVLRQDGWREDRIFVLDLPWPEPHLDAGAKANRLLYMGRLAPEKDVKTLLDGWLEASAQLSGWSLRLAGDGSEFESLKVQATKRGIPRVEFLGRLTSGQMRAELSSCRATVHPAAWYENSPFAVRESLMAGVPAFVAQTGGMPELVSDGRTGFLVQHSSRGWADALARRVGDTLPSGAGVLRDAAARTTSGEDHLRSLLDLYDRAPVG